MGKLSSASPSVDFALAQAANKGLWTRYWKYNLAATTAGLATGGYVSGGRHPATLSLPASFASGVTGMRFTQCDMLNEDASTTCVCALEYTLGSFVMNTSTFTDGVAMPTKTIRGVSLQSATVMPVIAYTVAATGTAPTFTITYTDQDGNTGITMTIAPPAAAAINSAYLMTPHLASGDTGIRDVTNISKVGGTNGTVVVYGLLPIAMSHVVITGAMSGYNPFMLPVMPWIGEAGERIAFYRFGATGSHDMQAVISAVADD